MVTDVPDSAYEICTKYAPNCPEGSSYDALSQDNIQTSSQSSRSSTRKSKSKKKNKSKSGSKTFSNQMESDIDRRNLRVNDAAASRDNSLEIDNLLDGLGINGEDDYYDSLNSGNENEIFGDNQPSSTSPPSYPDTTRINNTVNSNNRYDEKYYDSFDSEYTSSVTFNTSF